MHNEIPNNTPDAFLRIEKVSSLTGLARSTICREIKHGRFPSPTKITPGTSAWLQSEITQWIAGHVRRRLPAEVSG